MAEILILVAHPALQHSRVSRALMQAAAALDPARVAVRDLYALYPDYVVDVAAEQQALQAARLLVWLHPMHWYGMTPLLRLWQDEVLTMGWAHGPGGQALQGKSLWLVTSTGGGAASYQPDGYNQQTVEAFWPPYAQSAALCGMQFEPPLVVHGARHLDDTELQAWAAHFSRTLQTWLDSRDTP